MTDNRQELINRILAERDRQFNLPGAEWDAKNTPNDWMAIASSYCLSSTARKHTTPDGEEFTDDLITAAAVILAALENVPGMTEKGTLR